MTRITLLAPLRGWCAPLDETPDPVFAQRLLGEGVAIDPTAGTLHAPCDGEVISIAATRHALAVRAVNGAEILLHVGIDTVALAGEGFEALVEPGALVRPGQALLRFDLDTLARHAKSLVTPVLLTNGEKFSISGMQCGRAVEIGDALFEITAVGEGARTALASGEQVVEQVTLAHEHGIHARPAALIASFAKSAAAELSVSVHGRSANARSAVALMALGARRGDVLTLSGTGEAARVAVGKLKEVIVGLDDPASAGRAASLGVSAGAPSFPSPASGGGKASATPAAEQSSARARSSAGGRDAAAPSKEQPSSTHARDSASGRDAAATSKEQLSSSLPRDSGGGPGRGQAAATHRLRGVIASRGLCVGPAVMLTAAQIEVQEGGKGIGHESAELERARAEVRVRLEQLAERSTATAREVIAAHLEFLDDWELVAAARRAISRGKSAGYAWRGAVRESAEALRALGDPRMAERIDDLLDLESQVLRVLIGEAPVAVRELPARAVVVADDLKPSQLVSLDASKLAGLCLAEGGPTSHVAILAAAMGVPALVALGRDVLDVAAGTWLILDAEQGVLTVAPDRTALAAAEQLLAQRKQRRQAERAAAHANCETADGRRIEVFANLGSMAEAQVAVEHGAEGCGLLRTEFLFLERSEPPDEEEQLQQYQGIAQALRGRPLVVRTLDIGGDKPIPYLPLPPEQNPALGLRGVRTSLWRPDLLRVQLRAILRVQPAGQCRLLLPMITDPAEIRAVRRMLDEVRRELGSTERIAIGAMIETPASALIAERIAREVDFFSIGTNDLTQYALAMDRGHSELAHRIDALHPAVLRLIELTVEAARGHSHLVAVCGGLASDPAAVPVLLGLGVSELSVVPTLIPQLKGLIRTLTFDTCRDLARQALALDTAEAVRALANDFTASESQVTP